METKYKCDFSELYSFLELINGDINQKWYLFVSGDDANKHDRPVITIDNDRMVYVNGNKTALSYGNLLSYRYYKAYEIKNENIVTNDFVEEKNKPKTDLLQEQIIRKICNEEISKFLNTQFQIKSSKKNNQKKQKKEKKKFDGEKKIYISCSGESLYTDDAYSGVCKLATQKDINNFFRGCKKEGNEIAKENMKLIEVFIRDNFSFHKYISSEANYYCYIKHNSDYLTITEKQFEALKGCNK